MGEKTLVEVDEAAKLIEKLDDMGESPSLVCWYYYDDADEWRLLLASPTFDKLLPNQEALAYRKLVETMSELGLSSLTASDVKIIPTTFHLVQALQTLIRTGPIATVRAHFMNMTLNGFFIKEAIILRAA